MSLVSLRLTGIAKRYPRDVVALSTTSLMLKPGITGLIGPNGAGKTTLLRIVATVMKPSTGSMHFGGDDVLRRPGPLRSRLGYLPQDVGMYPHLDVVEFLDYVAALKRIPAKAAKTQIDHLVEELDLSSAVSRPLSTLSGGNRQRVAIAQALLGDPQVIVADEPTVGLDPEQRARVRALFHRLAQTRIVLISTHIGSDIEGVADRILAMARGTIHFDGDPSELRTPGP